MSFWCWSLCVFWEHEASLAPEIPARLPFRSLYSKLQGQPAVLEIYSLVSQGISTFNQPFNFLGGKTPAAPAAMPLEEQRSKTESMINQAIQQMQGWRDRTVLLQCLNSVVPMEGNLTDAIVKPFVTSMGPSRLLALQYHSSKRAM